MEHLELLAQLMHDSGDSSGPEDEAFDSRDHASPTESVGLIRQESAAASEDGQFERESSDSGGEDAAASSADSELSYGVNERVRSQLAGLRRKARLR
jgi:hypothetical protein